MAKMIAVKGEMEVKKSEAIIRARYKLNPLSLKFVTCLIAGLKRGDDINEVYKFRVRDFKELTQLKRKDLYWAVKEVGKELLEKPLYIPKGEDGNSFLMANWVADFEYKEGEGVVEFYISPKLRPYLLMAKEKFLKYRLENILPLRSGYSIRLYEILKDWFELYQRYKSRAEKIIALEEFKQILEIPSSYNYGGKGGIKDRILQKAKEELEKNTDIHFDFEEIKTGRKVTHIKFIIFKNAKNITESKDPFPFLKTKRAFVNYLRKHYINRPILETTNKNANGQQSKWSISERGKLYDMYYAEEDINATRSDEVFEGLWNFAKENEVFREKLARKE